jgi:hypothetical protein
MLSVSYYSLRQTKLIPRVIALSLDVICDDLAEMLPQGMCGAALLSGNYWGDVDAD